MFVVNGNGVTAENSDAVIPSGSANGKIVADDDHTVKDARQAEKRMIRRIRYHLRKTNCDVRKVAGVYYRVCVDPAFAIRDMEFFGREIHAIHPIGICGGCRGLAWQYVEGLNLCDNCANEVRR
jgi:hypothetical protein